MNDQKRYEFQVNDTDSFRYDIFEVGGEIIAKSVKFELLQILLDSLNKREWDVEDLALAYASGEEGKKPEEFGAEETGKLHGFIDGYNQAMNDFKIDYTEEDDYDFAQIVFKESENREANMNDSKDMNAISAIQLGIEHARSFEEKRHNKRSNK